MSFSSPPRVNLMAEKLGIKPGMSLDLTVEDPDDGMPWNFCDSNKRPKAERLVAEGRAMLLIGSPMCGPFSHLQNINDTSTEEFKGKHEKP